ncbi:MAG TPA: exodeoxyribonuclease III, partial [Candidatus Saccharimonadales bacterium]|nr:exodeoxyribonuclease III [Candidatus Saccharimonadales bacterium]
FEKLKEIKNNNVILIGDFNIAHTEIDLARPKQNKDNIMFTAIERQYIDKLINSGFVDTFRIFNPETGNYTWWSYAFDARVRNMGWRIDYCFVSKGLVGKLRKAKIYPETKLSDHCPVCVEIKS